MEQATGLLEKVVLGEVEGKNKAIHAYDSIIWKIRSGFLVILFSGWAILVKGIVEGQQTSATEYGRVMWGLLLFSLGTAFGAWLIDHSYTRRKFRVILALDRLLEAIRACGNDCLKIPADLLMVAGDNGDMPYNCRGYRQAALVGCTIYLVPLLILALVVFLLL
jgi:hypothetical protein